jgi:hypothetical protein
MADASSSTEGSDILNPNNDLKLCTSISVIQDLKEKNY